MEFFNRKEEVIDIQLTQYGKHLLSKGKFRPTHYAFFDDDVLYDIEFTANGSELQKETEDRIKSTPRIKAQYVFSGRELKTNKVNNPGICKKKMNTPACAKMQVSKEKHYALGVPLGKSSPSIAKKPAWVVAPIEVGPMPRPVLSGSLHYQKANREKTNFTFVSDTKSDYTNTITNRNKYIDLHDTEGVTYRIYFYSTAVNKLYAPLVNSPNVTVVPVSIEDVTDSSAGVTAEAIAQRFAQNGVKKIPLGTKGKWVFWVPSATVTNDTKLVMNRKYGPVKNHEISTGLTGTVTMSQFIQGRAGAPFHVAIPQLDYDSTIVISRRSVDELGSAGDMPAPWSNKWKLFKDGTYLRSRISPLMLEIQELNAPGSYENFDVEVFEIMEDESGVEELKSLYFQKPSEQIVNGILTSEKEQQAQFEQAEVTSDTVDYFFDLAIDDEIGINLQNFRRPEIDIYDIDPNDEGECK